MPFNVIVVSQKQIIENKQMRKTSKGGKQAKEVKKQPKLRLVA